MCIAIEQSGGGAGGEEVIAAKIAKAKATAALVKKMRGAAAAHSAGGGGGQSHTAKAAAAAGDHQAITAVTRLDHMSTAEYAANVGAQLACTVPDEHKMSRVLEARDYRGICLFADPATDVVYCPADVLAKVIDPRPLTPRTVARLGPWTPCTGLGPGAAVGEDDDEDADGLIEDNVDRLLLLHHHLRQAEQEEKVAKDDD